MGFNVSGTLDLDGRGWEKTLREEQKKTEDFAKKASSTFESAFAGGLGTGLLTRGLQALGLGAVAELGKRMSDAFMEEFKEIKIGSSLTNLDPDTFQRIKNTVEPLGGSIEQVAKSMEHTALAMEKIKEGGKEGEKMVKNMQALGVSLDLIRQGDYQAVWFKIAQGMKEAQMTGERLAALHEVEGKGAIALVPAFKKGFDNPAAAAGLLSDDDLAKMQQLKEATAETNGVWKDISHTAGGFFTNLFAAAKALPALFVTLPFKDKPRALSERIDQAFKEQAIFEKDQARAEQRKQEESAKYQAEQDQKVAAEEKKKTEAAIPKLQGEIMQETRSVQLAKMTPEQRKKFLKAEIEDNERSQSMFQQMFEHSEDFTGAPRNIEYQKRALEFQLAAVKGKKELVDLENHPAAHMRPQDMQFDSLARVGGFSQNSGNGGQPTLERIARSSEQTARNTHPVHKQARRVP